MTVQKMRKKKKLPLVCIAIVNWNGGRVILDCLKSLKKTAYPNYNIVILDNGSKDKSYENIKKNFKKVEIILSKKNLGYTAGINFLWDYCIKKHNPSYICNMNNDIKTIQKDWLGIMVKELEKEEKRGICGNKLLFPDGRLQLLYLDRKPKEYIEKDYGQYNFVKEVSAVGGANMLVKRKVIETIGGNDENFFYGPDDIDYNLRARKAGFKVIYCGKSRSEHLGSFSYNSSKKDFIYMHQSYGQMIFCFRHKWFLNSVKMVLNQFVRAFITRKDPFRKRTINNLYLHKSFLKRLVLFNKSLKKALENYDKIVMGDYPTLKK